VSVSLLHFRIFDFDGSSVRDSRSEFGDLWTGFEGHRRATGLVLTQPRQQPQGQSRRAAM
jgi:hypothetical protein